ncbi:MAG TPA: VOC family protein [Acidobacteriota bacterium]|nr:VOC family protein [Acidobacteriota bacterium]
MKIEHLALWTPDLERAREFYGRHFGARAGAPYHNPRTGFRSYFLTFADGARLELMQRPDIAARSETAEIETFGLAHFALSLGSEAAVDETTKRLHAAGVKVLSAPRRTGDGYYESVVLDTDGNRIELTV